MLNYIYLSDQLSFLFNIINILFILLKVFRVYLVLLMLSLLVADLSSLKPRLQRSPEAILFLSRCGTKEIDNIKRKILLKASIIEEKLICKGNHSLKLFER